MLNALKKEEMHAVRIFTLEKEHNRSWTMISIN